MDKEISDVKSAKTTSPDLASLLLLMSERDAKAQSDKNERDDAWRRERAYKEDQYRNDQMEREEKRKTEEMKLRFDAEERDKMREEKRMEREDIAAQRQQEFMVMMFGGKK